MIAVCIVFLGTSREVTVVPRANTSYFVSDQHCSNSSSGESPSHPWCTANPLDGQRLRPGDRLLFACGGVWREPADIGERPFLTLTGSGTSERPIIVGAYDRTSGAQANCADRPQLVGGSAAAELVVVTNPNHWKIANLELSHGAVGLRVHFTTAGHESVELDNLVVHDFKGIFRGDCAKWPHAYTALGVLFDHTLKALPASPNAVLRGIRVVGLEGYHNQGSIGILGYGCAATTDHTSYLYNDVEILDAYLHDDSGPAPACSDGLELISASDVKVVDSRFEGEGGCFTTSGTTGIILGEVSDVAFTNDIFAGTPNTKSPDQSGIDLEAHTRRVSVRGSYFGDNSGAGLEILTISGAMNFHTGFLIADNLFANNSRAPFLSTGEGGHIWRGGDAPEPVGTIENNLYSDEVPFILGALPDVTVTGNVRATQTTSSAMDWARVGSDWSAESSVDSGDWVPLRLANGVYSNAEGTTSASRFVLREQACSACSVARIWTAPRSGTVSIRGIAESAPGVSEVSATVRIQSGKTSVLSRPIPNGSSVATDIDDVHVDAGQKISFEAVFRDGGQLSWAPSIAYVG